MVKKRLKKLHTKDALELFNQVMVEQPSLPFPILLGLRHSDVILHSKLFFEENIVSFNN